MSAQALTIQDNILKRVDNNLIDEDGHVTIPDGVTSLYRRVFSNCSNLTSVTIPDSVTSIGSWVFSYCNKLVSLTIPNGVVILRMMLASGCESLTSITLHQNIEGIEMYSIADNTNLTTIEIPTDNPEEFERVKNLLPEELQEKAIIVPPFERVKKIKERALNNLLFNNNTNILKACGTEDSLYEAIAKPLGAPHGAEFFETLKIINTYDKNKIYKQIKRRLDVLTYPADEGDLMHFEEDCMAIVNEAIDKASSLNKYPEVYPEASNNFSNDRGFFKRIGVNTAGTSQSEQPQSNPS